MVGYSYNNHATITYVGKPVSTVACRVHRGLRRMITFLSQHLTVPVHVHLKLSRRERNSSVVSAWLLSLYHATQECNIFSNQFCTPVLVNNQGHWQCLPWFCRPLEALWPAIIRRFPTLVLGFHLLTTWEMHCVPGCLYLNFSINCCFNIFKKE